MQKVWSISGRSIAVSALALALAACQSMRGPEPVVKTDIPQSYAYNSASGTSIAEQGYKPVSYTHLTLPTSDLV